MRNFGRVEAASPTAIHILSIFGTLDRESVPGFLLEATGQNRLDVLKDLALLLQWSFIIDMTLESQKRREITEELWSIHRLVHLTTRSWLAAETKLANLETTTAALLNHCLTRLTNE